MVLMPSMVASGLWFVFFALTLLSGAAADPPAFMLLPAIAWELAWTTVVAFFLTLPAGAFAYTFLRLWRRHLTRRCSGPAGCAG